jgi:hypothetical protein
LILKQENELGQKIIEVDARPSDCLAIAIQRKAPIFVTNNVFEEVEDMSEVLRRLNDMQGEFTAEFDPELGGDSSKPKSDIDEPGSDEEIPPEEKG